MHLRGYSFHSHSWRNKYIYIHNGQVSHRLLIMEKKAKVVLIGNEVSMGKMVAWTLKCG